MSPSSMVTGIMELNVSISLYNKLFLFTDKPLLQTCTNCTYNLNVISNDRPNCPETLMYSAHRRWLGLQPITSLQEFKYMWTIENHKIWQWISCPYCIQLTNSCLACDVLWVSENMLLYGQLTTVSSGIGISQSYCIQLTDGGLVCDPLQVSKNSDICGQLKIIRSGIEISCPYCIQLTNRCLACDALQVSGNMLLYEQLTTVSPGNWNISIILYSAHRRWLGLRWIASL
jgi:hypothetical protein